MADRAVSPRVEGRLPYAPTLLVAVAGCLAAAGAGVWLGDVRIAPGDVLSALLHPDRDPAATAIVRDLRLPRVLVAGFSGAALAASGAALQSLTGNPLADPYLMGVASGASVGVGLAVLAGVAAGAGLPMFAFAGAVGATVAVFALGRKRGVLDLSAFLLSGIVLGTFLAAWMQLLLSLAGQDQSRILGWLMGYLGDADRAQAAWLGAVVVPVVFAFARMGRGLDAFAFGEDIARSAGVPVERFKAAILLLAALATAVSVATCGVVGFVGLAVPHVARALVGPPNRRIVPLCAVLGATLLICADTVSRSAVPGRPLPLGVLTALVGAPVFGLVLRRAKGGDGESADAAL
ncbi:MAG: FecCD family ABC transporter permease [Armatimonadota bacterium]